MSNIVKSYAHRYADLGWTVIPCQARDKRPAGAWTYWQNNRPDHSQIEKWAWPNVAIVTGSKSGVCVIDQDDLSNYSEVEKESALEFLASLPDTARARTAKGVHYYFRIPEGKTIPTRVRFLPGLDCRGELGYALAPPSIHPSGAVYVWEDDAIPEENLATLPDSVAKILEEPFEDLADKTEKWNRILSGIVEGEGRNVAATKVAGLLLAKIPQDMWPLAWGALKEWNQKNVPPMEEKELYDVFKHISKRELRPRAIIEPATENTLALTELLASNPKAEPHVVKDLLASGLTILVGKPKVGKSRLALQVALAVASDYRPFSALDTCIHGIDGGVRSGAVLYLALEDSPARFASRTQLLLGRRNIPSNFSVATRYPDLLNGGVDRLRKEIESEKLRLVVIDTLAAFAAAGDTSKGNAFQAEYRLLRPLFDLVNGTDTSILLLHHARKDQAYASDPFDSVAGTLGSQAAADSVLVMYHPKKGPMTLVGRGRDIEGFTLPLADHGLAWKVAHVEEE